MKWILAFQLLFRASLAFSEDRPDARVVDLGEMSVQGELRRPAISWIDSQKKVREQLPILFSEEYDAFEAQLLNTTQTPLKPESDGHVEP